MKLAEETKVLAEEKCSGQKSYQCCQGSKQMVELFHFLKGFLELEETLARSPGCCGFLIVADLEGFLGIFSFHKSFMVTMWHHPAGDPGCNISNWAFKQVWLLIYWLWQIMEAASWLREAGLKKLCQDEIWKVVHLWGDMAAGANGWHVEHGGSLSSRWRRFSKPAVLWSDVQVMESKGECSFNVKEV